MQDLYGATLRAKAGIAQECGIGGDLMRVHWRRQKERTLTNLVPPSDPHRART